MLTTNQRVNVFGCSLFLVVNVVNVRFAVPGDKYLRFWHLPPQSSGLLESSDPPTAFFLVAGFGVAPGRIPLLGSGPCFGPSRSQGNAVHAKSLQAVQKESASVILANGPQTGGFLQRVVA